MDINVDLLLWSKIFFDKETFATGAGSETLATRNKFADSGIKNEIMSDQQLAEELRKPIIIVFKKRKVHSTYRQYLGC